MTIYSQSANPDATNSELDAKQIITHKQLNRQELDEVIEQYVELVVDGMDIKSLVAYAIDGLSAYYHEGSVEELKDEIDNQDEELWDELVDNVTQQYPKQLNQFGG